MKISTRGRYAVRLMLDIAENSVNGNVSLKDVAKRQEISMKYLEQIANLLSKAGMIRSYRGSAGGYRLAGTPDSFTIRDILLITEGGTAPVACLDTPVNECPRAAECRTLALWEGLNKVIDGYLSSVTIADLMNTAPDYCI